MKDHFPRKGDPVNDRRRRQYFTNGFVVRVIYDDGPDEVMVRFDDGIEFYSFEELYHSYSHRSKAFELAPEIPPWSAKQSKQTPTTK